MLRPLLKAVPPRSVAPVYADRLTPCDGRRSAKDLPARVERLDLEVVGLRRMHLRLEAPPRNGRADIDERPGAARGGEHLPLGDLGGSVPARIHRVLARSRGGSGRDRRRLQRAPDPVGAIRAVGGDWRLERAVEELGAVQNGVVLPLEVRVGAHLEAWMLATHPPDDLPALLVDQVDRPGIARRNQDVAVFELLDRVHVEEVVSLSERVWKVAVADRHMVQGVPLPEHRAGCYVDLLDDP